MSNLFDTVPAKIRVRKFREADLPLVFRLFIEGCKEDPDFETYPPIRNEEDFRNFWEQTWSKARDGLLVAEVDGKVIGFIPSFPVKIFDPEQKDLGKIQLIIVEKNYRRKGVGSRLIVKSLRCLASKGVRTVVATTWFQNVASINLLKKCGFKDAKPEEIHFKIAVKDLRAKNQTGIAIRKAKDQDAKRIVEIGGWTKEVFDKSSHRIIVAEIDGEIAGFIDPFIDQCMNGSIGFFCLHVDPKYRRRGVGTTLVKAAFELFNMKGINCVYAFTTADNIPALKFLKKLGFEETRRDFTMRRTIT